LGRLIRKLIRKLIREIRFLKLIRVLFLTLNFINFRSVTNVSRWILAKYFISQINYKKPYFRNIKN